MFKNHRYLYLTLLCLVILDALIWRLVLFPERHDDLELYFLDVGQGDSQLILSDGVKVLIDGGQPNGKVLNALGKVLSVTERYIDLVIMSHPQLDHYGGLIDVAKNYEVGAFIGNGKKGEYAAYFELEKILKEKNIPMVALGEGDRIKYREAIFNVLNPSTKKLKDKELNETSLVIMLKKGGLKSLYTGDIGAKTEQELAKKYDLDAHILKISHHGSRFSSDLVFLKEVSPAMAAIGVGKNSYGHPTPQTLARLASIGSAVARTDKEGTIKVIYDGLNLKIYRL